jgi:hypothetical protein
MVVELYKNSHNAKAKTVNNESRKNMGLLWEIVQTGLMYGQHRKSDTIEDRVQTLEERLDAIPARRGCVRL